MTASGLPVLWHLKVSHYNEKARWALDYKGVPHVRRAVDAGQQAKVARGLTRGECETTPVLQFGDGGEAFGDSTRIIGWLEEQHPDPPLYPSDPEERRRALELEDFFDEELGEYVRRIVMHSMLPDPRFMLGAFAPDLQGMRLRVGVLMFPLIRRRLVKDFAITPDTVEFAYGKLRAAGERFVAEGGRPGSYLVGDRFSVADLTLAAIAAPAVAPEQFPYPQPQRGDPRFARLRGALAESGIEAYALDMYARHRGTSAEV